MELFIAWGLVPISIISVIAYFYFRLNERTSELYQTSPDTVARLLDYLDTLSPYLNKKVLDEHDGALVEDIVNKILDVDDGNLPFLSDDEEKVLSEFAYKGHALTVVFKQTIQEIMSRVKHISKEMEAPIASGYGYHK